jgi:hypothetical protein
MTTGDRRRERLVRAALAAALGLALSACTFEDGRGWATLRATAEADLAIDLATDAERAGGDDATLVTDQGHSVRVTTLTATVQAVLLYQAGGSGGGSGAVFDPASPPPGYTLCHAGHCHATDGSLVSYEDIAAELAAPGGTSTPALAARLPAAAGATLAVGDGAALTLGPWETDTIGLVAAGLVLRDVRLDGSVTVAGAEVPLRVRLAADADLTVQGAVTGALGRGGAGEATLTFVLDVPGDWFDDVRFPNLAQSDGVLAIDGSSNHAVAELLAGRLAQVTPTVSLATE